MATNGATAGAGTKDIVMLVCVVIVVYIASAIICAGTIYADFRAIYGSSEERQRQDLGLALFLGTLYGMFGPVGILVAGCISGFWRHGWRLR